MERTIALKRGRINLNTGEFPLVSATNGEASDGHILDVYGMEVDARVTLYSNHDADPLKRLGGAIHGTPLVSGKRKEIGDAKIRQTGIIDMEGDSERAEIRRDVAQGISVGDITKMSVSWSDSKTDPPIMRAALPKNHWAFSEAGSQGFNPPMFFPGSIMDEVSLVGRNADKLAMVGRANDTGRPDHVRAFYRMLVRGVDPWEKPEEIDHEQALVDAADDFLGREEMLEAVCAVCTARDLERADEPAPPEPTASEPAVREPIDFGAIVVPELNERIPEEVRSVIESVRAETDERIEAKAKAILYRMTGRVL